MYLKAKIPYTQQEFLALNIYLSSFFEKIRFRNIHYITYLKTGTCSLNHLIICFCPILFLYPKTFINNLFLSAKISKKKSKKLDLNKSL